MSTPTTPDVLNILGIELTLISESGGASATVDEFLNWYVYPKYRAEWHDLAIQGEPPVVDMSLDDIAELVTAGTHWNRNNLNQTLHIGKTLITLFKTKDGRYGGVINAKDGDSPEWIKPESQDPLHILDMKMEMLRTALRRNNTITLRDVIIQNFTENPYHIERFNTEIFPITWKQL